METHRISHQCYPPKLLHVTHLCCIAFMRSHLFVSHMCYVQVWGSNPQYTRKLDSFFFSHKLSYHNFSHLLFISCPIVAGLFFISSQMIPFANLTSAFFSGRVLLLTFPKKRCQSHFSKPTYTQPLFAPWHFANAVSTTQIWKRGRWPHHS